MAESTVGHNRVRDTMGCLCGESDPATAVEVVGLCPKDLRLRPADVLTRALHPTLVIAADVGIRAPHAKDVTDEPLRDMRVTKMEKYAEHRQDLLDQGIMYEPIIFSAYGRAETRANELLKLAAAKAARQRGMASSTGLLKWWRRQIAAEIWRRAARMVHACLPRTRKWDDTGWEDGEDEV